MNYMAIILTILLMVSISTIFIMLTENTDKAIKKRLIEKRLESIKELSLNEIAQENSASIIMKNAREIAKKLADKSKDLVTQKELLASAGMPNDYESIVKHFTQKVLYTGVLSIVALVLFLDPTSNLLIKYATIILCPLVGFRFPDMRLKAIAKKRADEVTYTLPDSLDLLSVCIEAGLGLDSAITRVAKEQEKSAPILSYEFIRVTKDILAGVPREDAFRNLMKRNGSAELRSFVSLLIQSDKLGSSISQSLKVYSDTLRTKRRQKAEELAAKAGVKMSIPLVFFILPATFIVIMAPAALQMYSMFTSGGMTNP